ncbi:MAG: hypothetical protein ABJL44_05875 [Algibacter sp.]
MKGISKKVYVVIIFLFCVFYSNSQNPEFKHLEVVFVKKIDAYSRAYGFNSNDNNTSRLNPFTTLKFKIKNTGRSTININLKNVYVLDAFDNYYPIEFTNPLAKKKIKIKGNEELSKTFRFDIRDKQEPIAILVEDKKFQLYF